ncbi:MAG TPA: hypothetical protein VIJ68_04205 [Candidatus Saccharimonadales bacterium]
MGSTVPELTNKPESLAESSVAPRRTDIILALALELQQPDSADETPAEEEPAPQVRIPETIAVAITPVRRASSKNKLSINWLAAVKESPLINKVLRKKPAVPKPQLHRHEPVRPKPTVPEAAASSVIAAEAEPAKPSSMIQVQEQVVPEVPAPIESSEVQIASNEAYDFLETTLVADDEATATDDYAEFYNAEPVFAEETLADTAALLESEVLAGSEVIIDDATMETFEQLIMLIDMKYDTAPQDPQSYETFMQGEVISLHSEAVPFAEANTFEVFVAEQPQPAIIPPIEAIVAAANEQPLEATLVQLSFYLAETDQASEDATELQEALRAVVEALPVNRGDTSAEEEKPVITPELTQKLLMLLRAAGYSNPREALIEFTTQYSFEFLMQAIGHLYQLSDEANQQEFFSRLTAIAVKDDESLSVRLGKAIVHYFFLYRAAPEF